MKNIACLFFLIFIALKLNAQTDTSIILKDVTIAAYRLSTFNSGLKTECYDSSLVAAYNHFSLSDLLAENSAASLKQYGPGNLSTVSLRGGSAYHTAVLWNGFSLASPLNGLTDLSILKNFFFDDIRILYGGSSALWGSGAVSGTVNLNSSSLIEKGFTITAGFQAGSFSSINKTVQLQAGFGKYAFRVKAFTENDKNNFSFFNPATNSTSKQVNSDLNESGLVTEHFIVFSKNSKLILRGWFSFNDRKIPPSLFQQITHAKQIDKTQRFSGEWKKETKTINYEWRSAYFVEKQFYADDFLRTPSDNRCRTFINEASANLKSFEHTIIQLGINQSYSSNDSSSELPKASISSVALFGIFRYTSQDEKLNISVSTRKEFSSLSASPFVYSSGINYVLSKVFVWRASASRVFRNPTLNDLYWNPGGNRSLKPETGYSGETGIDISFLHGPEIKNKTTYQLTFSLTGYYKKINNWIAWYPFSSLLWKPENLLLVYSRGLEAEIRFRYSRNLFTTGMQINCTYNISRNKKSLLANDASLEKQLIYVPLFSCNIPFYFIYRSLGIHINYSYTGIRYTLSDNSSRLEPYALVNIRLEKSALFFSNRANIFFRVNNLFATDYQSVQNRPMPLRSFETGINITLTIHSKKTIYEN